MKAQIPQVINEFLDVDENDKYAVELQSRNMIDWLEWNAYKSFTQQQVDSLKMMLESNDSESILLAKEIIKSVVNEPESLTLSEEIIKIK